MGGEWTFEFKYYKKNSLDISKYQDKLLKIREEFQQQFSAMKPEEGSAEWTSVADGTAPEDNIFVKFTYKCTKPHMNMNKPGHAKWTLLWDPKKANVKNQLHARCAPTLFKDLSNKIQEKLVEGFPSHFKVTWRNGLSGYDGPGTSGLGVLTSIAMNRLVTQLQNGHQLREYDSDSDSEGEDSLLRQMKIAFKWDDSDSDENERCLHHLPWAYCCDCSSDLIDMYS